MSIFVLNSCLKAFQHVDEKDFLPIHSRYEHFVLNFPKRYLKRQAILSVISASCDEIHRGLQLVLDPSKLDIYHMVPHHGVSFNIISKKIKLDFVSLRMTGENDLSAYDANTARMKVETEDESGSIPYTSKLIRNLNYDASDEISVLTHGRNLKKPNEHIIALERPILYFPEEIQIMFTGSNEKFTPYSKDSFPISILRVKLPPNFDPGILNSITSIECREFNQIWEEQPEIKKSPRINKNSSIEKRMQKRNAPLNRIGLFDDFLTKLQEDNGPPFTESSTNTNVPVLIEESSCKGLCIVIIYTKFEKSNFRSRASGGKADETGIKTLFEKLSYTVIVLENLRTIDLKECLQDNIEDIKKTHQNVIIFVSSHGNKGLFYTFDGNINFDELVQMFLPDIVIPKLFFFSCCQGEKSNTGIDQTVNDVFVGIDQTINDDVSESDSDSIMGQQGNYPYYSNIFMGFAAPPGYKSIRKKSGSVYIQALLKVIEGNDKETVHVIHQKAQNDISKKIEPDGHISIIGCHNYLTQDTYF